MIRGTNAQFIFQLPYDYTELEIAKITFWQPGNNGPSENRPLPIVKVLGQCCGTNNPKELSVTLNQEETLRFVDDHKAYVQLRATTLEGIPIASKERLITVYPVYDDSILDDNILPSPSYDNLIYLDGKNILDS